MYQHAISQVLSTNIIIRQFINRFGDSKQSTTSYITASLNHLGISLEDYKILQTSTGNGIRWEYYVSWDTPEDMLMSLKWTTNSD